MPRLLSIPGAVFVSSLLLPAVAPAAVDLLPDIVTVPGDLLDAHSNWGLEPGCVELRFTNSTANVGTGPAEIFGVLPPNPDGSQDVRQRIYRDDGTSWERLAGSFIYHPEHRHIHFQDWAQYSLRQVRLGGGVGPVLFQGDKTSFCLLDSRPHDRLLPGFPPVRAYDDCNDLQGISVGWKDRYFYDLPGQELRICGIRGGIYWLESEADPENRMLEADESNNVARVLVAIPPPPACNNGLDDDGDGFADHPLDPGCERLSSWREEPACDDGLDNDGDQRFDFPLDPGCSSAFDPSELDSACGLGFELALLLPALAGRLRRRARV